MKTPHLDPSASETDRASAQPGEQGEPAATTLRHLHKDGRECPKPGREWFLFLISHPPLQRGTNCDTMRQSSSAVI
jgi:hypothetical protein